MSYSEIGIGIVVTSSAYSQYGWPYAAFLKNLMAWVADTDRIAAVAEREEKAQLARTQLPELTVGKLAADPTVDGQIGAEEWADAAVVDGFVDMQGNAYLAQQTIVRVGQGSDGLYIAFECLDSEPSLIRSEITEFDGMLWTDDCVEVFLDPDGERKHYYHFILNAAGVRYDEDVADTSWSRFWRARTSRSPGGWTAEMHIPFASVGICASSPPADVWTANFNRALQRRPGVAQELSGWSATFSNFGAPDRFGTLRGIEVNAADFPALPDVSTEAPERWFMGANGVRAAVRAAEGHSARGQLTLAELRTGAHFVIEDTLSLEPGRRASIDAEATISCDMPHEFQFVLRSPQGQVLASSDVLSAVPAPVLETAVVEPAFRGTIQSNDPKRELWLRAYIGSKEAEGMRLRASLTPEGRKAPIWQQSRPVQARSEVQMRASLASVPEGDYTLRVDIEDAHYKLIAHESRPLSVLPPAPVEVTFTSDRVCYVNGKPLFPIGLYHVSEPVVDIVNARAREIGLPEITVGSMLRDCRAHGFNCVVRGWGMPSEDYLKQADDLGLWVMPEVGAPSSEDLAELVKRANKFGNVLMWYGVDEPMGDRLGLAQNAYARFKAADPHRPVSAALNNPSLLPGALQAYDLFMMDPYFIRHGPLEHVADWTDAAMEAGRGEVPIWQVPQAFGIDLHWEEPTSAELRCQAYLCINHGATGLVWYAYFTTEKFSDNPKGRDQWFLPDSHLWDYFTVLNAEIDALAPVFLNGQRLGKAQCDNGDVHTFIWKKDGQHTLIAVNALYEPVECSVSGIEGDAAEVLGEDRRVAIEDGVIRDSFKPLEVHIYRY